MLNSSRGNKWNPKVSQQTSIPLHLRCLFPRFPPAAPHKAHIVRTSQNSFARAFAGRFLLQPGFLVGDLCLCLRPASNDGGSCVGRTAAGAGLFQIFGLDSRLESANGFCLVVQGKCSLTRLCNLALFPIARWRACSRDLTRWRWEDGAHVLLQNVQKWLSHCHFWIHGPVSASLWVTGLSGGGKFLLHRFHSKLVGLPY